MSSEDQVNSILNDIEKAELQRFAENATMFEAVKKVLLLGVYFNGTLEAGKPADPTRNYALALAAQGSMVSNEQLGADLRASFEGIVAIETGFQKLAHFKSDPQEAVDNSNPAV